FPTTPLVASLPPSSETVFPASENPYAGVGANNAVQVDFDLIDIYGNHTRADAGLNVLPLPVRYTDNVIGLNQYPGLLESYKFASDGTLTYFMRLHAETFINTSQSPYAEWIDRISNARDHYRRVYWQLVQEDVKLLLNCSINKGVWYDITVASKTSFVQHAIESYKFLDALHNCTPEVSKIGDTLGRLAKTYRLSLEDLARPNQSLVGLFAAGKEFTVEYTISPKDTFSYLQDQIGANETDILKLQLSEGIITLGGTDYTVNEGHTLADLSLTDLSTLSDNDLNTKALFAAGTEMPNHYTIDADDTIAHLRKYRKAADADIVALPLKTGTVTLGGKDYTVKDGDTLASLGIKRSAISQNERDLQGLFKTGVSLTLKHTTAEGDSIVSIQRALQQRGITPLPLPVLLEGLKAIPLKREIKIATHLNAGRSEGFTTLTDSSPIKTNVDWAVANQNLIGIIKTGTNIGIVATEKDTLYTLATALGISVAETMQRVTTKDGWNEGMKVAAVPQPFSGSVKMETNADRLPDEFIFPLLTRITVRRDETLIAAQFSSNDFKNSSGAVNPVVEAYAYLAPHT
ncbi:MAG: hypothetical protein K8I82_27490, partial [Anaerolineae bacterium]|nr:hypothetical protein [Anaerolineae bacterium]